MFLVNRINKLQRFAPWMVIGLILLAAALRFYRLENKNIWWDEGWSVSMARDPLLIMAERTAHDTHPPGYYAVLHVWRALMGDSEFALRWPGVLAGVLLLAIAYRFVRTLAGTPAALITLGLLGFSRALIWYGQEVRHYALTPLLGLASLALAYQWWRKADRWSWWGYSAVTAAGLLTLYMFVGVLIAENLAALMALAFGSERGRRALALKWIGAQALMGASFLPWLLYYLPRVPAHFKAPTVLTVWEVTKLYLNTLFVGDPSSLDRYWLLMLPGLGGLGLGLALMLWPRAGESSACLFGRGALAAGACLPVAMVWALNLPWKIQLTFVPNPRYFITQTPWAIIVLGIAFAALLRRSRVVGLIAGGCLLIAFAIPTFSYYSDRYLSDDYKSAALTLAAQRTSEDAVVLHNDRDWPIVAYHIGPGWIGVNSGQMITDDQVAANYVEQAWQTHAGMWLLLTPESLVSDPDHRIFNWLMTRAKAMREFDNGASARLFFFARTEDRAATIDQVTPLGRQPETLSLSPAPGLTLTHADWALPEYRVGETLHLFLYWRNTDAPGLYSFALRVMTPQGQLAEEIPATLEISAQSPEMIRQQVDLPLRAYLGSGFYRLNLVAGETWADLGRLTLIPAQPHPPVEGSPAHPTTAHFESGIELQGYTVTPAAGNVNLTLYWTTSAPVDRRYKMFVHLLGPGDNPSTGNPVWAQEDREPHLGGAPVTRWKVGETIADFIQLKLPANAPAGEYTLEVGWYDFFTGDRLLVLDESGEAVDSRAVLGPFLIER